MPELTLREAADAMAGRIVNNRPSCTFTGYHLDSRLVEPGYLFFAIKADRDGHDFLSDAERKGAIGAVVSRDVKPPSKDFALIRVDDTTRALQKLAHHARTGFKGRIAGITGSCGKTTTRIFAARMISQSRSVLQSEGNFNNLLGLPLTLLKIESGHDAVLLEMAMSRRGEIKTLTQIADPDIGVITNIHPVHLEFFRDIEEIALAKKEILDGMNPGGTAVLNGDDPLIRKIARRWTGRTIRFGLSNTCDISAEIITRNPKAGMRCRIRYYDKREEIMLPFLYDSSLWNFLAAAAIASALDIAFADIKETAASLKPLPNRGRLFNMNNGLNLVDDSYNSNPVALQAVLQSLSALKNGRRIAVLGDMLELGDRAEDFHTTAGKQVWETGWDILVTVGPLARHMNDGAAGAGMNTKRIFSFPTSEEAARHIREILREGDLVLIKGSRGIHMEKIIEIIKKKGL